MNLDYFKAMDEAIGAKHREIADAIRAQLQGESHATEQLATLEQELARMEREWVRALPTTSDVPALVDDINKAARLYDVTSNVVELMRAEHRETWLAWFRGGKSGDAPDSSRDPMLLAALCGNRTAKHILTRELERALEHLRGMGST